MKFSVLSSGSKANCTLIQGESSNVLIDCGLSLRELSKRLRLFNLTPKDITSVIVTHEHDDHVSGVRMLARQFGTPIFMTEEAHDASEKLQVLSPHVVFFFQAGVPFRCADFSCYAHEISHDARNTVGLRITSMGLEGKVLSYLTDLGCFDSELIEIFGSCDGLILEANHDEEMLWTSKYPWQVKERIFGSRGHLSNKQAASFLRELATRRFPKLPSVLAAGHLSENSNTEAEAMRAFVSGSSRMERVPRIHIARADEPSFLMAI